MIREKEKLYDNLKQKECELSKSGEFNASRGQFGNFRKKYQDTRTGFEFPDAVNTIIKEKGCLPKPGFEHREMCPTLEKNAKKVIHQ